MQEKSPTASKITTATVVVAISYRRGLGGWAAVVEYPRRRRRLIVSDKISGMTNQRLSIFAPVAVLRKLVTIDGRLHVRLYTEQNVVKGMNEWLPKWENEKGGLSKRPNGDLWEELSDASNEHQCVEFIECVNSERTPDKIRVLRDIARYIAICMTGDRPNREPEHCEIDLCTWCEGNALRFAWGDKYCLECRRPTDRL